MNCPKCGHRRVPEEDTCSRCGIYYAKWEANQRRTENDTAVSTSTSGINATVGVEKDNWTQYWTRCAVLLLIVGFLLPLRKHSMLAGESFMVWPWQLAGLSKDPGIVMALGTYSEGANPGSWTLLPLATAALVFLAGRTAKDSLQTLVYLLTGLGSLILLLVVFIRENERLGLIFAPPTLGAGIVMTITVTAGALIAAANHASRMQPDVSNPARWAGAGGILLTCLVLFFMLGGDGPWKSWPMWGLFGLALIYAVLAAARLFGGAPELISIRRLSVIGRLLVVWSVVAVILSQNAIQDGFSVYVIQGGGSTASTVFAAVKGFSILYGGALLIAVGIAGILGSQRGY